MVNFAESPISSAGQKAPRSDLYFKPWAGFTLDLVRVPGHRAIVSLIAILAVFALPSNLDRIVRDQIKDSFPFADISKQPIAASRSLAQRIPASNAVAFVPRIGTVAGSNGRSSAALC